MSLYMDILVSARDGMARAQPPSSCPINELPIEILAKIFLYTVQLYMCSKPKQTPGNLASVCKKWREVTDTFGELWSHIYLGHSTTPDILKVHLIRSAGLAISIQLAEGAGEDHWEETEPILRSRGGMTSPNSLFNLLYQECHRWKAVYAEENQTAHMLRFITHQSDPLLSLQTIEVDISFVDSLSDFHRAIHHKSARPQSAKQEPEDLWPNLRSVTISTPPYHLPIVERYFIRSSITDLTLEIANAQEGLPERGEFRVWHWLREMPLLESLQLFFTLHIDKLDGDEDSPDRDPELKRHDHLRRIDLVGPSNVLKHIIQIVNCASAQLEHFGIEIPIASAFDRLPEPIKFTLPPLPLLKSLSIKTPPEERATFMVFATLPKIQKLIIDHEPTHPVDTSGTWLVQQKISQKPEAILVHVLERALENATNLRVEDASSETDYLRDLQLRSVYLSAKEEELITALAAKVR
jgi:hypothetical protein